MSQHTFGRWRFSAGIGELFDGESTIHLEPQVGKLLEYFLDHQNILTSRDELIDAVWDGRIVSDDAINRCVSILRQILTPDDKNTFIETVVRRGFIAHFPPAPEDVNESLPPVRRGKYQTALGALLLAALVFYFITTRVIDDPANSEVAEPRKIPVVAVLPFTNTDKAGDTEFFANGMHDDLLTQLAQLQSMRVISRTSMLGYKESLLSIIAIGKELGADAILEGGIQRSGDQIRINAQLIDARTDEHLWAGQFDRELLPANLFEVQTEIAQAITAALKTTLTAQDSAQLGVLPTQSMAAYRAYHQSMTIRDSSGVDDPAYLDALERAVALDPDYVRAWAELAGYLSFGNIKEQDDESIQRVEEILEHIRDIAPQSAEYLIAQAYYNYYIIKNYDQALLLAEQAHELRPSDPRILELKGLIQRRQGDFEGRIESIRQARTLDPKNQFWTINLISNLLVTHRYEEADREIANAGFQSFDLAILREWLRLREPLDPSQWAEFLTAIEREYNDSVVERERWNAYIWSRDFVGADEWLGGGTSLADSSFSNGWPSSEISVIEIYQLITYWFLQDRIRLESIRTEMQAALEEVRNTDGGFNRPANYLALAYLAAVKGETQETERLIRNWHREAAKDLAEFTVSRHYACRALGMAAAANAAVQCIRDSLVEPSMVMSFIEPYLPYYDAIRDTPEFVELLEELQQ